MMNSAAPAKPTLQWGAEALWRQLEPILPGLDVEVLASVASTNTALLDRARVVHGWEVDGGNVMVRRSQESAAFGRRAADVQPSLLVAEHQTGGRGRQGRNWQSEAGASLTFSLGLPLAVSDWSGLSLAVGVALAEAIGSGLPGAAAGVAGASGGAGTSGVTGTAGGVGTTGGAGAAGATDRAVDDIRSHRPVPRIGLKWPNDLWLMDNDGGAVPTGRKLGGVLIETVSAGAKRLVVVGVGLNVQPFPSSDPSGDRADNRADGLASGFASIRELDEQATAPGVLARVALPLVRALLQFEADGFGAFAERFAELDLLRGRAVRTLQKPPLEGTAVGVSATGALLLQTRDGLQSISSGEVSVRLQDVDAVPATARGAAC